MKSAKIKAYEVRESGEGSCCIVYATNSATARRNGACELGTEWDGVESCRRAPWADPHAPGPVPLAATLAAGWWHGCIHCGCTFDSSGRQDQDDQDDACIPVHERGLNFCSPTCSMAEWAERRERQARESAVIEACAIRHPYAIKITAAENTSGWRAMFTAPGMRHIAVWPLGSLTTLIHPDDADAFRALKGLAA